MPPHTSHLLQPLDVGVFGPLKRAYGKLVEGMMVAGTTTLIKRIFYTYILLHAKQSLPKGIYIIALQEQVLNH
jgi:hypothetical protein